MVRHNTIFFALAAVMLFILAQASFAAPVQIFYDNFSNFNSWTESNEMDWNIETRAEVNVPGHTSSNLLAHADQCTSSQGCILSLKNPVDLSNYESASLSFWRFVDDDTDSGEYLKVFLSSNNGATWNQIFHWTHGGGDDNTWRKETVSLNNYLTSGFLIKFVSKESSTSEETEIDDLNITGVLDSIPTASASANPSSGNNPLSVQFTGTVSNGNGPFAYFWDFKDGATSNLQNPSKTFASSGSYNVLFRVTDSDGDISTANVPVTVANPFDYSLSLSEESGSISQANEKSATVSFNLVSGQPQNVALSHQNCPPQAVCSFSNPQVGSGSTSVFSVQTSKTTPAGVYSINVNGLSASGLAKTKVYTLTVTDSIPSASISANPLSGYAPLEVSFASSVTGGDSPISYLWKFNDSTTSADQNPVHAFISAGNYNVTLTITDFDGDMSVANITITVTNLMPVAHAGHPQYGVDKDGDGFVEIVLNGSESYDIDGTIQAYRWIANGLQIGGGVVLAHNFAVGEYKVQLEVVDDLGGLGRSDNISVSVQDYSGTDSSEDTSRQLVPSQENLIRGSQDQAEAGIQSISGDSSDVVCMVHSDSTDSWIECGGQILTIGNKNKLLDIFGIYGDYIIWIAKSSEDKWTYYFNRLNGTPQTAKRLTNDHSHFNIDKVYGSNFLYYAEDNINSNSINYAYYINTLEDGDIKAERALTPIYLKRNFVDVNDYIPYNSIRSFYVVGDNKIVWMGYDTQRDAFAYFTNNFDGNAATIRRLTDYYLFDFTVDRQPTSFDIRDVQIIGNKIVWKARYGTVQHSLPPYSIEYLSQVKVWQYYANDLAGNENTARKLTQPFSTVGSILDDDLPSDMTYFKIVGDNIIYNQFYCKEGDISCISKDWAYYSNSLNGDMGTIRRLTRNEVSEFSFIRGNYLIWKGKRYDHTVNSGYQVAYYVNTVGGNANTIRRITQESPIDGIKSFSLDGNVATWKYLSYKGVELTVAYYSNNLDGDANSMVKISSDVDKESNLYGFTLNRNDCTATWTECKFVFPSGNSCSQKSKLISSDVTSYFACSDQHVFWFNFCGGRASIKESCSGSLESNAQCVNNELSLNDDFTIYSCAVDKCVEQKVSRDSYQAILCGSNTKCSANLGDCAQCLPGETSSVNCKLLPASFFAVCPSNAYVGIKVRACSDDGVWGRWPKTCSCQ